MIEDADKLNQIKVAAQCPASWEQMTGDDRIRFCSECNLNVYNLSALTRKDALNLVQQTEKRVCVRFYRREDGTIITDDCPVGLRFIRKRLAKTASFALTMILSLLAWVMNASASPVKDKPRAKKRSAIAAIYNRRADNRKRKFSRNTTIGVLIPASVVNPSLLAPSSQFLPDLYKPPQEADLPMPLTEKKPKETW